MLNIMKHLVYKYSHITFILILVMTLFSFTSSTVPKQFASKDLTFVHGEKLTYRLHYGWFNAGTATLEVGKKLYDIDGTKCYKYEVKGASATGIAWVVTAKDKWVSYVDTTTLYPKTFYRDISENNYQLFEKTSFYQGTDSLMIDSHRKDGKPNKIKTYKTNPQVHDMVSTFYYLRNYDFSKMKINDKIKVHTFLEDKLYDFEVVYKGKGVVNTDIGKVNAIKISPIMPENGMFDGEGSIRIWLSDDGNHIPIQVEADMFVGAVKMTLKHYDGTKYPLNLAK